MDKIKLAEIILKSQNNDSNAFEELYKLTFKPIYYMALKILKNENDAFDTVQEVYTSVFKNIRSIKNHMAAFSWMCQITVNKCNDILSKKKIPLLNFNEDYSIIEQIEETDENFLPAEVLDSSEKKQIILKIINSLPEVQRTCIILYYYEEMSVNEIADIMNCSQGTVKSRLNYARKHIRKVVLDEEQNGTKLYAAVTLPILTQVLRGDAEESSMNPEKIKEILDNSLLSSGSSDFSKAADKAAQLNETGSKIISSSVQEGDQFMHTSAALLFTKLSLDSIKSKITAGVIAAILILGVGILVVKTSQRQTLGSFTTKTASAYELPDKIYGVDIMTLLHMSETDVIKLLGTPPEKLSYSLDGVDLTSKHTYTANYGKLQLTVKDGIVCGITVLDDKISVQGVHIGDDRNKVLSKLNIKPGMNSEQTMIFNFKDGSYAQITDNSSNSTDNWKVEFMYLSFQETSPADSSTKVNTDNQTNGNNVGAAGTNTNTNQGSGSNQTGDTAVTTAQNTSSIKNVIQAYKDYYTNILKKREFEWWVADLNRDGLPEMLIAYGPNNDFKEPFDNCIVDIYGYSNNKVVLLYRKEIYKQTRISTELDIVKDSKGKSYIKILGKGQRPDAMENNNNFSIFTVESGNLKEVISVTQIEKMSEDPNTPSVMSYYSGTNDYYYDAIQSPKKTIPKQEYEKTMADYTNAVMVAKIEAGGDVTFEEMVDTLPAAFAYWEKCSDEQLKNIFQ